MENFIKNKIEVEEMDLKKTYKIGEYKRDWSFDPKGDRIFFVGPRGSGKTTVGKEIAQKLGMNFLDMDEELENRMGNSIAEVVKNKGWEEFRKEEKSLLKECIEKKGLVVATGGGVVIDEDNRMLLKREKFVFYLMGDVNTLIHRLREDKGDMRPPLTSLPLEEEIVLTLRKREPFYLEVANFILRADRGLEELTDRVIEFLGVMV